MKIHKIRNSGYFRKAFTLTVAACAALSCNISPALLGSLSAHAFAVQGSKKPQWRRFDDSIFAEAKRDNKYILMDLEAVWCHWCHVMDEKTYSNDQVLALLNERFICVKVDQDAQPDLSVKYEDYGWPATIFFDGEGREIVKRAGYIPPERMERLLAAIIKDPSPEPDESSDNKMASLAVNNSGSINSSSSLTSSGLPGELRLELDKKHRQGYDPKYGAWGTYQKFLDWDSVEYSMQLGLKGEKGGQARAKKTLDGQLNLLDPAFGGVYQYSTDGDWKHPHFEKIMQMQAENMRIYALGYSLYGEEKYLAASKSIAGFLERFLRSPQGAFYTSQDADLVPGKHSGEYFTLSSEERLKQGVPRVDQHIYTRENGWAITALAALYGASGEKKYLEQAKTATAWVETNRSLAKDGSPEIKGGFSHDEKDSNGPFLGDNLAMGRAYLALYGVTGERPYLEKAKSIADFIEAHFAAPAEPGYDSAQREGKLIKPVKLLDENVMLARFANGLYRATGQERYKQMGAKAIAYLALPETARKRKILVAGILLADLETNQEPTHITVVGKKSDSQAQALFATALKLPLAYKRIEWWDPAEGAMPNADTDLPGDMDKAAAFLCSGGRCSRPAFAPGDLSKILQKITDKTASVRQ